MAEIGPQPITDRVLCRTTLNRADWRAFTRHASSHIIPRAKVLNAVFIALILVPGFAIAVGLAMRPPAPQRSSPVGDVIFVVGALTLLLVAAVGTALRMWFLRRWWESALGRYELSSGIDGATVRRKGQSVHFTWESVLAWSEDQERFYVSIAPGSGWPFPKGDFGSEDDVDLLRMLLVDAERRTP